MFDACVGSEKELLWKFEVSTDRSVVVYSIDMKSEQPATATTDLAIAN